MIDYLKDPLMGVKVNSLRVTGSFVRKTRAGRYKMLVCLCDCGNISTPKRDVIEKGKVRSCGCLSAKATVERQTTHGMTDTTTYRSWCAMLSRCRNPRDKKFPVYGGRGITVAPEWMNFNSFLSDMGVRPEGTSIDRIDNNGNYEPSNCRWATPKQQMNNMSRCKMVEVNGERFRSISDAADRFGIPVDTARTRIKRGWGMHRTFTTPLNQACSISNHMRRLRKGAVVK